MKMANDLRGVFDVLPIRSPTVPAGKETWTVLWRDDLAGSHAILDAYPESLLVARMVFCGGKGLRVKYLLRIRDSPS